MQKKSDVKKQHHLKEIYIRSINSDVDELVIDKLSAIFNDLNNLKSDVF